MILNKLKSFGYFKNNPYFYYRYPAWLMKRAMGQKPLLLAEVFFERRCNFRCWHCSSMDALSQNDPGMSLPEIKVAIKKLASSGVLSIAFVGGEPTIRKDIVEIIKYCDSLKMLPTMISNGWLLNEQKIDALFDAGLANLGFSLQSSIAKEHDRLVDKNGAHERIMKCLEICVARKHTCSICVVPTNENLANGDFAAIISMASDMNLRVNANLPAPVGAIVDAEEHMLSNDSLEILKTKYFPMENFLPDFKLSSAGISVWCPMADTQIYVMPDGDVCPCTFTQISFGNILKDDMPDILLKMRDSTLISQLKRDGQCPISMDLSFIKKVNQTLIASDEYPPKWEDVQDIFEPVEEISDKVT